MSPVRDRLTAGRLILDQEVGVRIPVPQPYIGSAGIATETGADPTALRTLALVPSDCDWYFLRMVLPPALR